MLPDNCRFKLEFSVRTENYRDIESKVHNLMDANYEWVDDDLNNIIKLIKKLVKESV